MDLFNSHFWKFLGGFLVIVAIGFFVVIASNYYTKNQALGDAAEQQRLAEELEKQYMEDIYGGATPEETLALFIDALKAGDIDLAAKYFVIDKQEEWKLNLANIKNKGKLMSMAADLNGSRSFYTLGDGRIVFDIINGRKEVIASVDIGKGSNGVWKILDL